MRLFFALWPPPETAGALARWAHEACRATGGRATPQDSIHLTLAFLGEADAEKARAAAARVKGARHHLPLEQAKRWANGIVWAGPRETPPALLDLFKCLEMELYRENFILERRPFAAHVTLIRKARAGTLPPLPAVEWPVEEFSLMSSRLSSAGPSYERVASFPL